MNTSLKQVPRAIWAYSGILAGILLAFAIELKQIWWGGLDYTVLLRGSDLAAFIGYWVLVSVGVAWTGLLLWKPEQAARWGKQLTGWRWPRFVMLAFIVLFPAWFFFYTGWSEVFSSFAVRLVLFLAAVISAAVLLRPAFGWQSLLAALILVGSAGVLLGALVPVVDYPFTLYWSEGNRFWDYSVRFGADLYTLPPDTRRIPTYIDAVRQTLWGLPFLLPNLTIFGMRLWNAILFTIPYGIFGLLVFKYLAPRPGQWLLAGLGVMIFLYQGPIYTPLVLSAAVVAISMDAPWLLAGGTGWAAYYANRARFTWMFAPAAWGVLLQFAHPARGENTAIPKKIWWQTFAIGLVGVLSGVLLPKWRQLNLVLNQASQAAPAPAATSLPAAAAPVATAIPTAPIAPAVEPTPVSLTVELGELFISPAATSQPLIWSRLWPNETYGLGIVLGLLLAVGPLLALLVYLARSRRWGLNNWQRLAVFGALFAFLVVGIIISVKIGGGSNLHNLDMFLITVVFAAGLAYQAVGEEQLVTAINSRGWLQALALAVFLIPAFQPLVGARPLVLPDEQKVSEGLTAVYQAIDSCQTQTDCKILFMDHRQLLTFGYVTDVTLYPAYEKKLVMDKALSGDAAYFQKFYADLAAHQFTLIVTEPQKTVYHGEDYNFGSENDAWVGWVSEPLLCYYEPLVSIDKLKLELLVPRTEPLDCSFIAAPTP